MDTIEIVVNGERRDVARSSTVSDLLAELNVRGRFAVELNETIVPRSRYGVQQLTALDRVEIVHAIGGG
jgi:sulfur carrier protein